MSQVCTKCSRVNPSEAVYCYFDGVLLQGHLSANGGPVNPGTAPFATPFVFPTGQTCQNFDQLAMACQQNWETARDLLKQGFLVGFFGGLGRADLAKAAQEAAKFPDHDRGLDQMLAKLPSQVLEQPKLKVEPSTINLGTVPMGIDRHFDLQLENQGMRLIYGTAVSDSKWLLLGDGTGQKEKIFQFGDETTIQVHVRGQDLRASPKPLIGQIFIESNTGAPITIKVRLEVPVKPFAGGALAGAKSPREIAVKAKENPQAAATLFENGAVAQWFKDNGWTYPVQGPAGSGIGAVQQFFEALGLAKPPKVVIDKQSLALMGNVGQSVQTVLKVETPEKRPVYAHATADEAWLDVSQTKIEAKGRVVLINVRVPSVPHRPGETLTARVRVAANGNQRFSVPVTLTVQGSPGATYAQPAYGHGVPVIALADEEPPAVVAVPGNAPNPFAESVQAIPAAPASGNTDSFQFTPADAPVVAQAATVGSAPRGYAPPSRRQGKQTPFLFHLLPMALLAFALLVTIIADLVFGPSVAGGGPDIPLDGTPRISIFYDYKFPEYPPEVQARLAGTMSFGIRTNDPRAKGNHKQLTFDLFGNTNSTMIMVDGKTAQYGNKSQGTWLQDPKEIGKWGTSKESVWIYPAGNPVLDVIQKVERIPGDPFIEEGVFKRALDTCLIRYEIKNRGQSTHKVGLRMVLDTYIGTNDGTPFTVPGVGLVDEMMAFPKDAPVPDFLQALERPDLTNPGTVVQVNLKIGEGYEAPSRVLLTLWPGWGDGGKNAQARRENLNEWEVPLISLKKREDSALVLYWDPIEIKPGQVRKLGFTYGLGHVSSETGQLGLTVSSNKKVGDDITITARVSDADVKTIKLSLPKGIQLKSGESAQRNVPDLPQGVVGWPREVTWQARATQSGIHEIEAATDTGITQRTKISIHGPGGLFGN